MLHKKDGSINQNIHLHIEYQGISVAVHMTSTEIAESYYKAMSDQNMDEIAKYIHPDIQFVGPLDQFKGKDRFLKAVEGLFAFYTKIDIVASFGEGNQAMLTYHMTCVEPINLVRAAVYLTVEGNKIKELELFYDARPFERAINEIFKK